MHGWITSTWYPVSPYYQSSRTVYKVDDSRPFTRENVRFPFHFEIILLLGQCFSFPLNEVPTKTGVTWVFVEADCLESEKSLLLELTI